MPTEIATKFVIKNLKDASGTLTRELSRWQANPTDRAQLEFVTQILLHIVEERKMYRSTYRLDVKVMLDACLAISRQDLFLDVLETVTGKLDDEIIELVAGQITANGLAPLRSR